jgi:hypothetical protein
VGRSIRISCVALALVVAGACSSGSKVTKAEYVKSANAICSTTNARIRTLGDPGSDMNKSADIADQTAAITASSLRKLRALKTPKGDESTVATIYTTVDAFLADVPAVSANLRSGDSAGATNAEVRLETDLQAANAAALGYGLTVCGSSS